MPAPIPRREPEVRHLAKRRTHERFEVRAIRQLPTGSPAASTLRTVDRLTPALARTEGARQKAVARSLLLQLTARDSSLKQRGGELGIELSDKADELARQVVHKGVVRRWYLSWIVHL